MNKCVFATTLGILLLVSSCGAVESMDQNNASAVEEEFMGAEMIAAGGEPGEQIWCAVLEQQAPRKDCEIVSQIAQVSDGSAAFNVPDPMKRGEHVPVQLFVDRRLPTMIDAMDNMMDDANGNEVDPGGNAANGNEMGADDAVGNDLGEVAENVSATDGIEPSVGASHNPTPKQQADKLPGTTDKFALKVGRRMRAGLTGQGFAIIRRSPIVEEIPRGGQGTWTWDVVALQGGPKSLTVTTVVEATVNGHTYLLQTTKHVRTVTVGVSFPDRVLDWLRGLPGWLQAISAALLGLAGVAGAWWLVKKNWRSGPGSGEAG
ncbi:MAG TPA: hypothetical protein VFP12_12545 [Allosphingosinicella sp.]|nr:hypothetical protein [Allosphingosinicella sp.]